MTYCYLGIDPGAKGGIALMGPGMIGAWTMPSTDHDLLGLLRIACKSGNVVPDRTVAALELVHSMPKQGVASSFAFGRQFGKLEMALAACEIPYQLVTPQTWQKGTQSVAPKRSPAKNTKEAAENRRIRKAWLRQRAQQLFPSIQVTAETADALLIALYCSRLPWFGEPRAPEEAGP